MKPISLLDIRRTTGARSVGKLPVEVPSVTSICTDSRKIDPGCLFVAIKEDIDGNLFAREAATQGALGLLVEQWDGDGIPGKHILVVPDARKAMGKLATLVRQQLRGKVVAVAGSNGKTSTKHLIDAALSVKLRGSISPKSYNNDVGVPLTIFAAESVHDYLVLEVGTNHPGEIKVLSDMARPDVAVITNCGADHLEFFGDLLGVRTENAQITSGVDPKKGLLIVHGDDAELLDAVSQWPGRRITFGLQESNDLFAADLVADASGIRFKLNGRLDVSLPLLGAHNALNALAAIAVARRCGVAEETIVQGLAAARGPEMRLQKFESKGVVVINDAYNANPSSVKAALETVKQLSCTGKRVVVLGDMKELGDSSQRYHREVGQLVAQMQFDQLVCVGIHAGWIADSAKQFGMNPMAILGCGDAEMAATRIPTMLSPGDVVLIKGSRSMKLEKIAEAILK